MAKEKKSASALAALIRERLGSRAGYVEVHKDPVYGWHATVMTAPSQAVEAQRLADEAAMEFRQLYDLNED